MLEINKDLTAKVVAEVIRRLEDQRQEDSIPVGVSNRHIHLSKEDLEVLFGEGYELGAMKQLMQPGEYAAEETLDIEGPKGTIKKVRILGPVRKNTQVEISLTDGFTLGFAPPVKESGKIEGTPGIKLIGPKGSLVKNCGVIAALRHIHFEPEFAERHGIKNGDMVCVKTEGVRGLIFDNVLARVSDKYVLEMHVDTDEANACGIKSGDKVKIVKTKGE